MPWRRTQTRDEGLAGQWERGLFINILSHRHVACQHKGAEVACYQPPREDTVMGYADLPR